LVLALQLWSDLALQLFGNPENSPPNFAGFKITRVIARPGSCHGNSVLGLFQEMLDHCDHLVGFRREGEVTGIGDHGKLGVWDEVEALNRVLKLDKVAISESDEYRRLDRS
jgi:hypothetical protein